MAITALARVAYSRHGDGTHDVVVAASAKDQTSGCGGPGSVFKSFGVTKNFHLKQVSTILNIHPFSCDSPTSSFDGPHIDSSSR